MRIDNSPSSATLRAMRKRERTEQSPMISAARTQREPNAASEGESQDYKQPKGQRLWLLKVRAAATPGTMASTPFIFHYFEAVDDRMITPRICDATRTADH